MYMKYTTLGILEVYYMYTFCIHLMYTFCISNLEPLEVYKEYTLHKAVYLLYTRFAPRNDRARSILFVYFYA